MLQTFTLGSFAQGAAGGGGSFESIATVNGTGSANTLTFSSIPSTYQHLQIRGIGLSAADFMQIRINGDSGTNYTRHQLVATGTTVAAGGTTATDSYRFANLGSGGGMDSTYPNVFILDLHDYTSTSRYKTFRGFSGVDTNGGGTVNLTSSLWLNTNAVTSLTISNINGNNFSSTTRFALYGIKGA